MRPETHRLDDSFDFLDEAHRTLVTETTRLSSITEEHSQTNYSSGLYTKDLYMPDTEVEDRMEERLEQTREAMKAMDAALTVADEQIERLTEKGREPQEHSELLGKKAWYKEKYIELAEQIEEIEQTSLVDKTTERNHTRVEYEVPETDFSIEKGKLQEIEAKIGDQPS